MLTVEANERLTRVGPGTPMGELMRRYWIPVRPIAQLMEEEVMAVRLLGEDLVLFRSADGQMGLVGDRCPHRMTELRYGIPDEGGLRCCYHGWMFAPSGQCIETPLEAEHDPFKDRIRVKGYPVQEMGGLVWAYMGPEPMPLLPPWDLFVMPNSIRQIGIMNLNCNWLQCHENTGDPAHSVYLHGNLFEYVLRKQGKLEERAADGQMHTLYARMKTGIGIESLYVNGTRYGMEKGIKYSKALGADRDHTSRHATVIFPLYTQTGGPGIVRQEFQIRVPVDDTNTYHINYGCYMAPEEVSAPVQQSIPYYDVPLFDDEGKPLLDFVLAQDAHAWISQGPITDRTQEHPGADGYADRVHAEAVRGTDAHRRGRRRPDERVPRRRKHALTDPRRTLGRGRGGGKVGADRRGQSAVRLPGKLPQGVRHRRCRPVRSGDADGDRHDAAD